MSWFSAEFIKAAPKTDLHLHLDGSLRISTLIELAKEAGVALPAQDEKGLRELVFKDSYQNLEEYLRGFGLTTAVMQTEKALFRISYELMMDSAAEGVRYLEARFAPQLLMSESMSFMQVMQAIDQGFKQARDELNAKLTADEPVYDYGLIVCAMRFFTKDFSPYYREFARSHPYSTSQELIRSAGLELAKAAAHLRAETDIQLVGFDLAGAENGFPAADHAEAYALAQRSFLGKTVHAGEAYGPESIFQATAKLQAQRIGHGLHLFDHEMIHSPKTRDPLRYVNDLVNYMGKQGVTIEVCLTSNMQTSPDIKTLREHALSKMLENRLSLTLCTDNRLVSNTSVCQEWKLALENFAIDPAMLRFIALEGFAQSFFYHSHAKKQQYLASIAAYYDKIAAQFGIR